jgi:hypothetical protein
MTMTETVVHRLDRPWCDNKDDDDESGHECYRRHRRGSKPEQYTTGDPGAVTWEGVVILALSHDDKRGEGVSCASATTRTRK